jgi:membrane associated rhomboid family serine protease
MTVLLIAANVFFFLVELGQPVYLQRGFITHYALVPDHPHVTSLVTSMFLHGGWLHLLGNMWFLWVFGSHVEEAMGSTRFLIFYLICGVASALVQLVMNLGSPVPTIGASGAIAGVMGAFLLLYPRSRVVTLVFIFIFITTFDLPAAVMLLYWFAIQLISGLASSSSGGADAGGVAWFAHVGGFLMGMLLVRVFLNHRLGNRRRYSY